MIEKEQPKQSIPKGKKFCPICGEIKRDTAFEVGAEHCKTCAGRMLRTKLRIPGILAMAVMLAVTIASVVFLVHTVSIASLVHEGDTLAKDSHFTKAGESYILANNKAQELTNKYFPTKVEAMPNSFFSIGLKSWEKCMDAYATAYGETDAWGAVTGMLDVNSLASSKVFSEYAEMNAAMQNVSAFISTMNESVRNDITTENYNEAIRLLDEFAGKTKSPYEKAYTNLFKASATQYYLPESPEKSIPFFESVLKDIPTQMPFVMSALNSTYFRTEQYGKVIECARDYLKYNKDATESYEWMADAYYNAGQFEKCLNVIDEMREASDEDIYCDTMKLIYAIRQDDLETAKALIDAEHKAYGKRAEELFKNLLSDRQIDQKDGKDFLELANYALYEGAYHLIMGDTKAAYDSAYERGFNYAYYYSYITQDSTALTQNFVDMGYIVASLEHKKDEIELTENMSEISEVAKQLVDGKLTAREVFVEGKAELL